MAKKYVVTITRQFGSMGRPIARELSERLGIEYYDRDIVEEISKQMNLPVSTISQLEVPRYLDTNDVDAHVAKIGKSMPEGAI